MNQIKHVAFRIIYGDDASVTLFLSMGLILSEGAQTMSRSARQIPKVIAEFGVRQFKETGAQAVEVLRVKASTIRKHFRRLAGIAYLVAVISRDRVRVYFFDLAANMLLGENLELSVYAKIRKTSRLITKFEKPREPTPEELRMEATEEIRTLLAKSIKRVARLVARPEPSFPALYVTKGSSSTGQSFGTAFDEDGTVFIEESAIRSQWIDGITMRLAFLLFLDSKNRESDVASCVANGVALSLLRNEAASRWMEIWLKKSKGTPGTPYVNHLIRHASTYSGTGFRWLLSLLEQSSDLLDWNSFGAALSIIHDGVIVSLGTEEYHLIKGLCDSLSKPRRLQSKRHVLPSIHLAPRAIGDPLPLGQQLSVSQDSPDNEYGAWATVTYVVGDERKHLTIGPGDGAHLLSLEYGLDIEDIIPKTGGVISHGKTIISRALRSLGIDMTPSVTMSRVLEFRESSLPADQRAVLERICQGGLGILSDSLVGSPQRIISLINSGHLILLPDFHHVGIDHDFLIIGSPADVKSVVSQSTIEYTLFMTENTTYAVVSAPGSWRNELVSSCLECGLSVYPIIRVQSSRGLLRDEELLPASHEHLLWR